MVAVFIVGFIFGFLSLVILAVLFNDDAFKPKDKFTVSFRRGEDPCWDCCEKRYKPIILQEHDAEPIKLRAILDVKTDNIYILETTKGFAEGMGMTIEEVEEDEDGD